MNESDKTAVKQVVPCLVIAASYLSAPAMREPMLHLIAATTSAYVGWYILARLRDRYSESVAVKRDAQARDRIASLSAHAALAAAEARARYENSIRCT